MKSTKISGALTIALSIRLHDRLAQPPARILRFLLPPVDVDIAAADRSPEAGAGKSVYAGVARLGAEYVRRSSRGRHRDERVESRIDAQSQL